MQFVTYPTVADQFRKCPEWKDFYTRLMAAGPAKCRVPTDRLLAEYRWWEAGRPYYNCYPKVTPLLTKLRLDIPMSSIHVPHKSFLVRFREDDNSIPVGKGRVCKSILFSELKIKKGDEERVMWSVMATFCEPGQSVAQSQLFLALYRVSEDITLEEAQKNLVSKMETDIDPAGVEAMLKIVCTICLLGQDSELLVRDILANDRNEYGELDPDDPRCKVIEDRAVRRGKNGWDLGKAFQEASELSPHWRNPHLCLVHTGEGGKIPKTIFRRGCMVKVDKATKVPSEYLGNDPDSNVANEGSGALEVSGAKD